MLNLNSPIYYRVIHSTFGGTMGLLSGSIDPEKGRRLRAAAKKLFSKDASSEEKEKAAQEWGNYVAGKFVGNLFEGSDSSDLSSTSLESASSDLPENYQPLQPNHVFDQFQDNDS